jgi:hypothetical protein
VKFTAQKRENAKRENDFRVRVSKKVKFFRVLFLRFRVSKTQNWRSENAKITVPLPLQRYRDRASAAVTDRYGPFLIVTKRYMRYRTLQSVTYFIFQKTLNRLF